jgi:FdhD protein
MSSRTASFVVTRVADVTREVVEDAVAVEEPLEILAAWTADGDLREKNISITMRTPADDFDLAAGFLLTEGLLADGTSIESIRHWGSPNRVRVRLSGPIDFSRLERNFISSSSCGVCGKTSIDALRVSTCKLPSAAVNAHVITSIPRLLKEGQTAFTATGGMHGAAMISNEGQLVRVREDVGRHNAVDKLIGSFVREGSKVPEGILAVSSRASFEIVQKAIVARIPAVVAIGAPSSLAIDLAREFNLVLAGFARDDRFNVYAGEVG